MAAARSGALRIGDAILSVNGEDVRGATHETAVELLKTAGTQATLEGQWQAMRSGCREVAK